MIWIYLHIDELTYDISRYITAGSFLHISLNPFMSYSMVNDPFPRKKQTNNVEASSVPYIYIHICVFHNTSGSLNRCLVSPLQEFHVDGLARKNVELKTNDHFLNSHRIHGAGIYANIWGILMVNASIHGSYGIVNQKSTTETWIVNSENRSKETKSVYFFSGSITGIAGIINSQDNHQNQDLGSVHEHELLKPTWLIEHGQTSEPQKTNQGTHLKL